MFFIALLRKFIMIKNILTLFTVKKKIINPGAKN